MADEGIDSIDREKNDSQNKNEREKLARELSGDYAKYMHLDVTKQQVLEENIEDMLTRMDEYCGLIDMVRSDGALCFGHTLPEIYAKVCDLEKLFVKIDKLQLFINMIQKNLDVMEERMNDAECQLSNSSVKKLFTSLQKPLFSKKNPSPDQKILQYEPPELFETANYFSENQNGYTRAKTNNLNNENKPETENDTEEIV
ncbi:biogenesis of lysosome-related organelles complex 1 subunit 4-like isoform X2 [Centruroides sculpturatus]|uniref:biogenesis of lysosome-related organelles complex 1 subunit 4-like isoform X2 n=1 Tax=Centruroides sculpturatus TaxID=218467 RepID=UPI000C6E958B|nr:biogenesis of lysosome-related organelles complex 1 subunit 4-like isoform X2 [Centruroides sculpturatus]